MMEPLIADGYSFHFKDAIDAFIFDEKNKRTPTFHGAPMKGVDIVAEFTDAYLFVELKDYDDLSGYDVVHAKTAEETKDRQKAFKWLKNYLKYKYRDTFLYRYAEQKVNKPVFYICLLTFDNALNSRMQKALKSELPTGKPSKRWLQPIANSCQVVNVKKWNENFPKWPVEKVKISAEG